MTAHARENPASTPFASLISAFRDRRVLVLGDVILDAYIWGSVNRISPEAPVPVVEVRRETFQLGGAANVVANLRAMGATAWVVGTIGSDSTALEIRKQLRAIGVDDGSLVVDHGRSTTVKTRIIAHAQQVVRVDRESRGAVDGGILAALNGQLDRLVPEVDAVVISDYGKGIVSQAVLEHLRTLLQKVDIVSVVDPKQDLWHLYDGFTAIAPNHHEAAFAAGMPIDGDGAVERVGRHLMRRTGVESLIITCGERGMVVFDRAGEDITDHHIPTVAKEVYDVTGAGDTVVSMLALALGCGVRLVDAAVVANYAAGIVVGEIGTATVSPAELTEALDEAFLQGRIESPQRRGATPPDEGGQPS